MTKAWASADMSIGGSARSFPSGGSAESALGYGQLLWGSEKNLLYGFMRLSAAFEGVPDYFASTVAFEIFPVSILGLRVGRSWSQSHLDYKDFDCAAYFCRGHFLEDFVEVPLYLGAGPLLFAGSYRVGRWEREESPQGSGREFIEPSSGLNLSAGAKDELRRTRGTVFFQFTERWSIGYSETIYNVRRADGGNSSSGGSSSATGGVVEPESRLWVGLVRYAIVGGGVASTSSAAGRFSRGASGVGGDFSLIVGAGEYRSHLLLTDPTFVMGFSYAPLSKLGY